MNATLRPSTMGEILDRTASLYRAHFLAFVGLAAPPSAVLLGCFGAMALVMTSAGTRPEMALAAGLGATGIFLVGLPLYLGAGALSSAAIAHAGSASFLEEPITIRGSYKAAWKHGWRYLGVYVLQALLIAVGPFVVWMVAVGVLSVMRVMAGAAASVAATAAIFLIMAVLTVYAIWMLLQVVLAFPAAVVEEAGPATAIKRAWTLCSGTRLRILVLFLLGLVISWIVSIILMTPLFLLAAIPALNRPEKSQLMGTIVIILFYGIFFAVQALTKPIYGIAGVLFYYDQRVRKEGFDVELLMRQAGMLGQPVAAAAGAPWMPVAARPAGPWPEREEAHAQGDM